MKTLHILTATAGILLTLAAPSFAASRTITSQSGDRVNTVRTYGERDLNNPPWEHKPGYSAYARGDTEHPYQQAPEKNRRYPYGSNIGDYYGGPNSW